MALPKPSYRLGKPWRSSQRDRRNYIVYLTDRNRNKGSDVPANTLQDFDYEPLQDGNGDYLTE